MVTEYGKGCIKAKIDLKTAFRMVPIVAEEWEGPLGIPLPGTAQTLALFVTDLCMNLQLGTIQVYISAVSYLHHMNGHRSPASNNPMIKFLGQGVERSMPVSTDYKRDARADAFTT